VQAEKTSSEDATVEVGTEFAFDEASNWCSLLARVGEEGFEVLTDDFVEERFLGLVARVVDHVDPVRDRVGARGSE